MGWEGRRCKAAAWGTNCSPRRAAKVTGYDVHPSIVIEIPEW
jgi:hypothetical protein